MKKLFAYLKPYAASIALGVLIKFMGTIMDLLLPWILAYMIDHVVPLQDIHLILFWGLMMVVSSIFAITANITANRMASRVARDTTEKIRHDLFIKISYLSCSQVDDFTVPSLISRLTSDTYHVHHMIGMMQRIGIRAPILILGGLLVTLTLDKVLALILLAVLPFLIALVWVISKKGIPLYESLQQSVDKMVRTLRENITGIRVIKALSKTEYEKNRFTKASAEVVDREKKASMTMAITSPAMNLFLNLGLTFVILVGAYRVNSGLTQPGKIIAFLTYFTIILHAMLMISRIFVVFSKGSASFQRICEVLETSEDLILQKDDTIASPYHISFDGVSFSYHKQQDHLTDISFDLKQGQTLGIIGTTGSGKSSIVKLLMRFYDVDKGVIRINGKNVKSIPKEELHIKFGVVLQNDMLFADTIGENINFGRGLAADEVAASSVFAQAEEFIYCLPDKYQHVLAAKGSNLSGGQKQRILIARALAANPEILIFDDSSSALDYQTDAHLRQSLYENFRNTTTIMIAQRISSIMHADHILVLDDGKIIGAGTHVELLKNCRSYQEMNQLQMEGI